jgi:hypothetical protein
VKCPNGDADCDPDSQHPCWPCKVAHWQANGLQSKIPRWWKGPSGAELARQEVAAAKANGVEIQYAGPGSRWV